MIAQGLEWHHWKVLLRPDFSVIASLFSDAGAPFIMQMLSGWKTPIRVSDNLGDGTFVYEGAQATDGPASLAVALTGPDSLIQRLQALTAPAALATGPSGINANEG